jgi:nucleotide-binding universal stress UspA family protein
MYTRILVPLDGSATAEAVLPYARALAAGFKTAIELLLVVDIGAMAAHMAAERARYLDTLIETAEKNSAGYLENLAKTFSRSVTECRVVRGKPEDAILETASRDRNTLIAMATHGRSGATRWLLGSVAEKVLRGTTNPLFLVRAGIEPKVPPQPIINSIVVPLDGSRLAEQMLATVSSWAQALDVEVTLVRAFEFPAAAYYGSEEGSRRLSQTKSGLSYP